MKQEAIMMEQEHFDIKRNNQEEALEGGLEQATVGKTGEKIHEEYLTEEQFTNILNRATQLAMKRGEQQAPKIKLSRKERKRRFEEDKVIPASSLYNQNLPYLAREDIDNAREEVLARGLEEEVSGDALMTVGKKLVNGISTFVLAPFMAPTYIRKCCDKVHGGSEAEFLYTAFGGPLIAISASAWGLIEYGCFTHNPAYFIPGITVTATNIASGLYEWVRHEKRKIKKMDKK